VVYARDHAYSPVFNNTIYIKYIFKYILTDFRKTGGFAGFFIAARAFPEVLFRERERKTSSEKIPRSLLRTEHVFSV
jgi:hypothetical protein